jgi:hypothetical protein
MVVKSLGLALALLISFAQWQDASAADAPPALSARESGVAVYSRQDPESDRVATLEKGEALTPIAESIGTETWYMVRARQNIIGWMRAADVVVSTPFTEKAVSSSTWEARTAGGRVFSGTWSLASNSTPQNASGGWTLSDAKGTTVMRGAWSAEKHATGWNGTWQATVEGRAGEYNGSWSADFPHVRSAKFAELFEAAAKQAISGLWTGGSESGSWSIRIVK